MFFFLIRTQILNYYLNYTCNIGSSPGLFKVEICLFVCCLLAGNNATQLDVQVDVLQ